MFKRSISPLLKKALGRSPVVLLNGARQVGKTTLVLEFFDAHNFAYITFDDEITYLAAKNNISGFIADLPKPIIIDEVQRVPEIFLAIKRDVDLHRTAGRYLLTGSANPLLLPTLGDSLVGRMEVINLMPLSQGEILDKEEHFIETVFGTTTTFKSPPQISKEKLYHSIIMGGYPPVQGFNEEDKEAWIHSYLSLLLQRDIRDLAQIEKLTEFPNLLRILGSRASNLLNNAEIARDSKMVAKTVQRYLALFETIFIIYEQPSWHTNVALRSIKSPKLYFSDTGFVSYLLDVNLEKILQQGQETGRMLENFVVNELKKQATWSKIRTQLYHFRSTTGSEVDVILENQSGNIVGIEIKNNEKVTPHDFKGLIQLQEKMGDRFKRGIVLYTGNQYLPYQEKLCMMPIQALWEQVV